MTRLPSALTPELTFQMPDSLLSRCTNPLFIGSPSVSRDRHEFCGSFEGQGDGTTESIDVIIVNSQVLLLILLLMLSLQMEGRVRGMTG